MVWVDDGNNVKKLSMKCVIPDLVRGMIGIWKDFSQLIKHTKQ